MLTTMDARSSTPDWVVNPGNGRSMMTRDDLMAMPTTEDTISGIEWEIRFLDPDVMALIAEVDAILCATPAAHRRPPAPPPVTGRALLRSRSARRSYGALIRPRRGPAHPVHAVQRSPPTRPRPRGYQHPSSKRQVMASPQR
jgi:hypothetical protein